MLAHTDGFGATLIPARPAVAACSTVTTNAYHTHFSFSAYVNNTSNFNSMLGVVKPFTGPNYV